MEVRERMVHEFFNRIDHTLARKVAEGIGVDPPTKDEGATSRYMAPEVSVEHESEADQIATRKVVILLAEGFEYDQAMAVREALEAEGAWPKFIAKREGKLAGSGGREIEVDMMLVTTDSVLWDAVWNGLAIAEDGGPVRADKGVVTFRDTGADGPEAFASEFIRAIGAHRHWDRTVEHVPA